jgi:putative ABC transport system permease protein
MLPRARSIARMLFHPRRWRQDLSHELQFHIEERADELERDGLARPAAVRQARLEFGGVATYSEECREAHGIRWLDELSRNLAYAARSIRRNPGFSVVAVLSLALGIGANLAVFHVLDRLVLTRLPVPAPDQLYQLVVMQTSGPRYENAYPKFELMRDNFDAFKPLFGWGSFSLEVAAGPWKSEALVAGVTGNYFDALGVHAAVGRLVTPRDDQAHASGVAVISDHLWRAAFAGDPDVVGRTLTIADAASQDQVYRIVGVVPSEFDGTEPGAPPTVYLPLSGVERIRPKILDNSHFLWFHVMGRLPGEVSLPVVRTMLRERWARLDEANRVQSTRQTDDSLVLEDGSHGYSPTRQEFSRSVVVLMGLVAAVFLIGCANVATLLFVRGAGRAREMSIRLALGAARSQLARQWMTECFVLAAIGGLAGLVTARWITDLLLTFVADGDRAWLRYHADPAVVLVGLGLTLAAGLLCGLLPAIRAAGAQPDAMRWTLPGALAPRRGPIAQCVLAAQLAASLVLVVGGALFARTLWNLNGASPGFDRHGIVYGVADLAAGDVARSRRGEVVRDAMDRLRQSPLVDAVSMGEPPMVWGNGGFGFVSSVQGYVPGRDDDNTAYGKVVDSGYFGTIGIPFVAGRDFERSDHPQPGQPYTVTIVNQHFARHYFGDANPIGKRFVLSNRTFLTIVGVVGDARYVTLREAPRDTLYFPIGVAASSAVMARPRPGVSTAAVASAMRRAFAAAAKGVPVDIQPLEQAVQRSIGRDRLVARLSAAFALLGLLLASIGLYGAIAHSVKSRTREIGIRIAVGAQVPDVVWMVLKQGLAITAAGVLVGLPLAMAGSRLIASLLFDVSPWDPLVLAVSAALLTAVALAATLGPAWRAARLDASRTLRYE